MENTQITKHSIFKIQVYKKTHKFYINKSMKSSVGYNIFYNTGIYSEEKLIKTKIFKEVNISMPLLNVGDSFYFEDEDKEIVIQDVIRTDKDNVLYIVNKEIIEDKESLKNAKEMQNIFTNESLEKIRKADELKLSHDGLKNAYENLKTEYDNYKSSSWVNKIFGNNKKGQI
jgi:hypothetical protein